MGSLFEILMQFIAGCCQWLIEQLWNSFITLLNGLIVILAGIYNFIIGLLPNSCFVPLTIPADLLGYLDAVNWFVPLDTILNCISAFCCMMIGYFVSKPILKFIRMT